VRTIQATFVAVEPAHRDGATGVVLEFQPVRARLDVETIRDFAELGPSLTIPAVAGLGKVLRILRAARLVGPPDPLAWVGCTAEVCARLERARGTRLLLSVRRRARVSFVAWTERGVETVRDVVDVVEQGDELVVLRGGSRTPVRFPRAAVSRRRTERERWYEVIGIERP